jgi:hypothetical protein
MPYPSAISQISINMPAGNHLMRKINMFANILTSIYEKVSTNPFKYITKII